MELCEIQHGDTARPDIAPDLLYHLRIRSQLLGKVRPQRRLVKLQKTY